MHFSRTVKALLSAAVLLFVISHVACEEGGEHDQSGFCVIDPFMAPAFLGFEHWKTVGITLGVVASGLVIAAIMLDRADYNTSVPSSNHDA